MNQVMILIKTIIHQHFPLEQQSNLEYVLIYLQTFSRGSSPLLLLKNTWKSHNKLLHTNENWSVVFLS